MSTIQSNAQFEKLAFKHSVSTLFLSALWAAEHMSRLKYSELPLPDARVPGMGEFGTLSRVLKRRSRSPILQKHICTNLLLNYIPGGKDPVKPDWIIPREMRALVAVIPIKIPAESDGIRNVALRIPFAEWWCLKQSVLLLCIKESDSAVQSKLINCFSLSVWAPRGSVCVPRKKYINYSFCRAFINHVVINTTNAVNWR